MRKDYEIITERKEEVRYSFTKQELQKLVDIIFEQNYRGVEWILLNDISKRDYFDKYRDTHMAGIAKQLDELVGIKTTPMGSSWGVITN